MADAPNDKSWPDVIAEAADLLEDARTRCELDDNAKQHRRGCYASLHTGVSFGGGQTVPGNLCNRPTNATIVSNLNGSKPFQRLARFATLVLKAWHPRLYEYNVDRLGKLHAEYPTLRRNFTSCAFAAATYNLGPQTACYRHLDFMNVPFGMCAVTALGDFDHTKGGHLILWDARLVIEFPPGTTILIPSSILSHSNVAVSPHERRYSFTQYTAGGLMRWVENGFQRSVDLKDRLRGEALRKYQEETKGRWRFGLSLLTRLSELDKST